MSQEPQKIARTRLPLLSDQSIPRHDCDADHFGLDKKLGALVDAVFLAETDTPFAAMLSGGWGVGKTSAMAWLNARFSQGIDAGYDAPTVKVDTCWFYPWKYQSRDDVWRGLVAEVILAAVNIDNADTAKVVKAARQFGSFLGRGFVRILSSLKLKAGDPSSTGVTVDLDLKEAVNTVMEEYGKHVTPHEAYFNEFEDILRRWVEDAYPKHGGRRLVVFIDDLDRCMPDIALQVLEALKLYLNVPNLVFIVGVDRAVIDRIVDKRYADLVGTEAMAAGFADRAACYLDKMFPVELNVVPTDEEVGQFFDKRIVRSTVWQLVREEHRQLLRNVLLGLGGNNPRTIVRLVNRVVIAYGRHSDGNGPSFEQEFQRELLDVVCQSSGFDEMPQRSAVGRRFFATWSRILRDSESEAVYLPEAELKARLAARTPDEVEADDFLGTNRLSSRWKPRLPMDVTGARQPNPRFDHLAPLLVAEFAEFRSLLSNLRAAQLLAIPYPGSESLETADEAVAWLRPISDELWEKLRHIVAQAEGIDPARLNDETLRQIKQLNLVGSSISDLASLAGLSALQTLNLGETPVSDISPLAGLTGLQKLYLNGTKVVNISALAGLTGLQELDLSRTQVVDISSLAGLAGLQELDLHNTEVIDISALAGLQALRGLDLVNTQVQDISCLSRLANLERLFIWNTLLADISSLVTLTRLQDLFLVNTPISDVDALAKLSNLQTLHLIGTRVSDVSPLASLTCLFTLNLTNTRISDAAPLGNLVSLKSLSLPGSPISDFAPVAKLTALEYLDLGSTQIVDVSLLAKLTALEFLSLSSTVVTDVSAVSHLTRLTSLDLRATQVSDVSPLTTLTALKSLDLSLSQVSDISSLARLIALQDLNLVATSVTDVYPLRGLPNLKRVVLPNGSEWNPQKSPPPTPYTW